MKQRGQAVSGLIGKDCSAGLTGFPIPVGLQDWVAAESFGENGIPEGPGTRDRWSAYYGGNSLCPALRNGKPAMPLLQIDPGRPLIWHIEGDALMLMRTGTHAGLFG